MIIAMFFYPRSVIHECEGNCKENIDQRERI